MDKETQRKLSKVGMSIPKEFFREAVRKEKSDSSENLMYEVAKSGKFGAEASKEIGKALERGDYAGKTTLKVNEQGNARINDYLDRRVKSMIAKGEIPKPKVDSWMKKFAR